MTCLEKVIQEDTDKTEIQIINAYCPHEFGLGTENLCPPEVSYDCELCWNRKISEVK